jgi:hypothetical protein
MIHNRVPTVKIILPEGLAATALEFSKENYSSDSLKCSVSHYLSPPNLSPPSLSLLAMIQLLNKASGCKDIVICRGATRDENDGF